MRILVVLLTAALALAGCTSDSGSEDHEDDNHDSMMAKPTYTLLAYMQNGTEMNETGVAYDFNLDGKVVEVAPMNETANSSEASNGTSSNSTSPNATANTTLRSLGGIFPMRLQENQTSNSTAPNSTANNTATTTNNETGSDKPSLSDVSWEVYVYRNSTVAAGTVQPTGGEMVAEDGGIGLPATYSFTFEDNENYTFYLIASIPGSNASSESSVTYAIAPAAPEEPVDEGPVDPFKGCQDPEATAILPAGATLLYISGSWIYEESNGVPGLQWNNNKSQANEVHKPECTGGDTVIL